jgi:hypothetical protein
MKLDPPASIMDLPIPEDVRPTRLWTGQMLELAAHVGPYAALLLIDRLGGQSIRVPMDPERNRMREIIGAEKTIIMSRVYGGNSVTIPVGRPAVEEAKRGPVLAAIREQRLTINEAVPILRTSRTRISHLINNTDEGLRDRAWLPTPEVRRDRRQLDLFPAGEE